MVQQMPDASDPDFLSLQEALVGRYSLEREVGRGGMGIVYLAHEVALDRPVALKLLPPEYAAQPALRERFLREARTAALAGWRLPDAIATIYGITVGAAMLTVVPAGLVAAARHEFHCGVRGEQWLRFWKSRLGRWIFKLGGLGLERLLAGSEEVERLLNERRASAQRPSQ